MKETRETISIGLELRLKRTEKQLSMKEVADAIGISENFLSQVERDKKQPSDSVVTRIANFYKMDEAYLFERFGRIPLVVAEEIKENRTLHDTLYDISTNKKLSDDQKDKLYLDIQRLYREILDNQ
ncbi:transcriptional regulator with XRE-family HTH domain [Neobacillus niacini]|uniref:helix-turn-helix domain-containing protein n=1 Tax=Neobacillus driksii TaxID=3035913 RepID=UPI002786CFE1|nr:helix-turn-helix transcriptional regulator [Neobacillus niacini]MDQ0976591.1 transcriptional regulator with XRE-family HTH domain [Neobacillus niacini]